MQKIIEKLHGYTSFFLKAEILENGQPSTSNVFLCTPKKNPLYAQLNADTGTTRLVWQLYTTGPGMCVDGIQSIADFMQWIATGSLKHITNSVFDCKDTGTFTSFTMLDTIHLQNTDLPTEIWVSAIQAASVLWKLDLPWTCEKCNKSLVGTDANAAPYISHINALKQPYGAYCTACWQAGLCAICQEQCTNSWDMYHAEIADELYDICYTCTTNLLNKRVIIVNRSRISKQKYLSIKANGRKLVALGPRGEFTGVKLLGRSIRKHLKRHNATFLLHNDFVIANKVFEVEESTLIHKHV